MTRPLSLHWVAWVILGVTAADDGGHDEVLQRVNDERAPNFLGRARAQLPHERTTPATGGKGAHISRAKDKVTLSFAGPFVQAERGLRRPSGLPARPPQTVENRACQSSKPVHREVQ